MSKRKKKFAQAEALANYFETEQGRIDIRVSMVLAHRHMLALRPRWPWEARLSLNRDMRVWRRLLAKEKGIDPDEFEKRWTPQ